MLECKTCRISKPATIDHFESRKDKGVVRLRRVCKECMNGHKKEYYSNNVAAIGQRNQKHYIDNKDKKQDYYVRNKKRHQETGRLWEQRKKKEDPCFKVRKNLSRMVNLYLHKGGYASKGISFFAAVGYTLDDLRAHLESLWEPWMNWENYGPYTLDGGRTWQVDHIIPQSKLPYDSVQHPNFIQCWALTNLRPLDSKENVEKGNRSISVEHVSAA